MAYEEIFGEKLAWKFLNLVMLDSLENLMLIINNLLFLIFLIVFFLLYNE